MQVRPTRTPEFLVLRHGTCELNKAGRLNGRLDPDLAEEGERQAEALRDSLERRLARQSIQAPLMVYSSPLRRALRTARVVTDGLGLPPALELPALEERCLGDVEGMTYTQALAHVPDRHKINTLHGVTYAETTEFGFETFKQATKRARGVLNHIELTHGEDDSVWLFTHGDFALALVAARTGRPMKKIIHELYLKNTEGVWLHSDEAYTHFVPDVPSAAANATNGYQRLNP